MLLGARLMHGAVSDITHCIKLDAAFTVLREKVPFTDDINLNNQLFFQLPGKRAAVISISPDQFIEK